MSDGCRRSVCSGLCGRLRGLACAASVAATKLRDARAVFARIRKTTAEVCKNHGFCTQPSAREISTDCRPGLRRAFEASATSLRLAVRDRRVSARPPVGGDCPRLSCGGARRGVCARTSPRGSGDSRSRSSRVIFATRRQWRELRPGYGTSRMRPPTIVCGRATRTRWCARMSRGRGQ